MIEFKNETPTIAQIYQYTYLNRHTISRFFNEERDVLKTKIKIERRVTYKRNKENMTMTPSEYLIIYSESTPQYYPYNKVKTKGAKKQRKIHHQYDCFFAFSKDKNGNYNFWESKVIFRIGGYKKWQTNVPQNKVKSIFKSTRERIEKKYSKLPSKEKEKAIRKDLDNIRRRGKYLDVGDYNSQVNGLNGDFYFRDAYVMQKYSCLYGRNYHNEYCKGIDFPFFPKHALGIIHWCLKRGIIKYK